MAKLSSGVPVRQRMSQLVKKPDAKIYDLSFKDLNKERLVFIAYVSVNNPYCIDIPIKISFSLKFGNSGKNVANGGMPYSKLLKGKKETKLEVEVVVKSNIFKELYKDVVADLDIDCRLDLELIVDLPVIRNCPIRRNFVKEIKLDAKTLLKLLGLN